MFERYTEKARRTVFFARYEASQFGSAYIETEHLLLGVLREDKPLVRIFLPAHGAVDLIRNEIESATMKPETEPQSTSVDLPLSNEGKRVLAHAAEEADKLGHKHIGTEHIFLGLLREEDTFAAKLLHARNIRLSAAREKLVAAAQPAATTSSATRSENAAFAEFGGNMVQAAIDGQLMPVVGREAEMERLIQILSRYRRNNAVLLGEEGVGKRSIVEGLAQRIADCEVPSELLGRTILAVDPMRIVSSVKSRGHFEDSLGRIVGEVVYSRNDLILYVEGLHSLVLSEQRFSPVANVLRAAIQAGTLRCVSTAKRADYVKIIEKERWLENCFHVVEILPPDESQAIEILRGIKNQYEKFHGVTYTDEALQYAVYHSNSYMSSRYLPEKAIDVIDEAATAVKLNQPPLPEEIVEIRKKMKLIRQRMENAIQNHEFEKARFYSDEERKERENLRALEEKHKIGISAYTVTRDDIEKVMARWTGLPAEAIHRSRAEKSN